MRWVFRTMIVTVLFAPLARALAESVAGSAGAGMFISALCPANGPADAEPTHYISTGMIEDAFAPLLQDAGALYDACSRAGAVVTLEQCQALVAQSVVSEDAPFDVLTRLELQLQQPADRLMEA